MITQADSIEMERIQMQALKSIFGWRDSYAKLLEKSGLQRLDTRREEAFMKLASKMSESARYSAWFPKRVSGHSATLRHHEKFSLHSATTERYLNSPINIMRRKLIALADS